MRTTALSVLFASLGCVSVVLAGCSSDDSTGGGDDIETPAAVPTTNGTALPTPDQPPSVVTPPIPQPGADNPGPKPAGCTITKDKDGFFTRTTGKSSYVGFVPKSYTGQPTTLVVGIHGCGDSAKNFATWGVNPGKTIDTQIHIGISIGGRDGQCWDLNADSDKVTAAIADISTCFYVHQQKIVLAGYSSGGMLAYKLGLTSKTKYAGIIIENSSIGNASPAGAAWKLNVAHIAHTGDDNFPIGGVRSDWTKLEAAGIPLQKSEVGGGHDGTSADWSDFLIPKIAKWKAP